MTTQSPTLESQATAEPATGEDLAIYQSIADNYNADHMNAHYLAGVEAGRASRAPSEWEADMEDADGNPLVTVRSDALVALGEFALTPALTSIRVGDERLSRVELTSRLMDAVKCAAPAAPTPPVDAVPGEPVADHRCRNDVSVCKRKACEVECQYAHLAASVASRAGSEPVAMVLVPMHMTDEMEAVTRDDSWQWEDLLAAAGAITEEQYDDIAAGRSAPAPVTTLIAPAAAAAAAEPSEDEQRKSFEARARKSGYSLLRDGDEYRHPPTQHAWQGWMMGAEATPDRERAASLVASEEKK